MADGGFGDPKLFFPRLFRLAFLPVVCVAVGFVIFLGGLVLEVVRGIAAIDGVRDGGVASGGCSSLNS